MLNFACKPDGAFHVIVEKSLESALADMKTECSDVYMDIAEWFGDKQLIRATELLLEAHKSEKKYMPNEYHWYLLNRFLYEYAENHNYKVKSTGKPIAVGEFLIKNLNFDEVLDLFFWDADYELTAKDYNKLDSTAKSHLRFGEGQFGLANRLQPHESELALTEIEPDTEPVKNFYKSGNDYP